MTQVSKARLAKGIETAAFWLVLFCLTVATEARQAAAAESQAPHYIAADFVTRSGHEFRLHGKTFRVAGVNCHYLTYGSHKEVVRVLDDAVAMNASVVRVIVSPIVGSPDGRVPTVFDRKSRADASNLGVRNVFMAYFDSDKRRMEINDGPNGLQRLDFVVHEASKRKLRLIVALIDYWGYTGGARQIDAWYGHEGDDLFIATDARAKADYKRFAQTIILRRNKLSGVVYKDDPTIFAWELMNEPEIHPFMTFYLWAGEMAAFIKGLDDRHLLASGQASIDYKMLELRLPQIDFGTWHGYPAYRNIPATEFGAQISQYCRLSLVYDKPVVLEEFGVARSDPQRPQIYSDWLEQIRADGNCAGWLVWRLVSRQDSGKYPRDDYDQFDIHNDASPVWLALRNAAQKISAETAQDRRSADREQGEREP